MADVNSTIRVNIDTRAAQAGLASLQKQISQFNKAVAASNMAGPVAATAMSQQLLSSVGKLGQFSTAIKSMDTQVNRLGQSFDRGNLSARQYFRYAASQVPGLAKGFKSLGAEQAAMTKLAEDRVKRLGTRYVDLGKDINGVRKVMALRPDSRVLNDFAKTTAMAQQRMQLLNRAVQLGSTGLVNWGKNTQWAGRQLMVGFSVPLMIAAGAAAKFYMELDKASMQFRRVYGDLNTSTQEVERNLEAVRQMGIEYTKYGVAVKDVVDMAARAAATGAQNEDLLAATEQTLRLATLGQMEYQRALDATIALQTAFSISSEDLGDKINFLNAVENQTILTMEDMALAVPRVAPVIKGLGGDVEDLAVFMTALREGGVTAEQGANALKSGLASLINPTRQAKEMLLGLGISIEDIVQSNRGDLMGTVKDFGEALSSLGEFERQQALEQVFGKYQYARLGALFKNIANDASQSAQAMDLAKASTEELAQMAEKELGVVSETVTNKFLGAVERLKVAIAPLGEFFLTIITPVVNAVSAIADAFNNLPDGIKKAIGIITVAVAGIAPVALMVFGLLGNALGNTIKFFGFLARSVFTLSSVLKGQGVPSMKYMASSELDAMAAATSLDGATNRLTSNLLIQTRAVQALAGAFSSLASSAGIASGAMARVAAGGMMGRGGSVVSRAPGSRSVLAFADGGIVPGTGNKDTIPAMLTPGESVITKEATAKYGPVLAAMNAGTLPGFNKGYVFAHGQAPTPLTEEQKTALRTAYPKMAQPGADIRYGLSNYGFMTKEKFNQGEMSGKKAAKMFTGKQVDRTMLPMYRAIAQQLSQDLGRKVTTKEVMKDPVIRKDVRSFADNIARGLAGAGAKRIKDSNFYAITDKALKQTQFANPSARAGIMASKGVTTVAVAGGPFREGQGERQGINKQLQRQYFGATTPLASYKDDEQVRAARSQEKQRIKDVAKTSKEEKKLAKQERKARQTAVANQEKTNKASRPIPGGRAAAALRMAEAGMPAKQVQRMMRKYGGRIAPVSSAAQQAFNLKSAILSPGMSAPTPTAAASTGSPVKTKKWKEGAYTASEAKSLMSAPRTGSEKANIAALRMGAAGMSPQQIQRILRKQEKNLGATTDQLKDSRRASGAFRDARSAAKSGIAAGAMAANSAVDAAKESRKNMMAAAKTAAAQTRPIFSGMFKDVANIFKNEMTKTALPRSGNTPKGVYDPNLRAAAGKGPFAPTIPWMRNNMYNDLLERGRALRRGVSESKQNVSQRLSTAKSAIAPTASVLAAELKKSWGPVSKQFEIAKNSIGKSVANMTKGMDFAGKHFSDAIKKVVGKVGGGGGGGGGILGGLGGLFAKGPDGQSRFSRSMTGGKMAGAGMGLSMASMIPFMNQDAEGKFMGMNANMLGMGMMGGGMLMSMAPMLGGPATAAIAALSAAGVALYAWRNSVDESARSASEFGANIGGAANALNNMAAMMGKMTPAQRQTQMRLAFTEEEQEMSFGEFQNMFNTEEGQKFIEQLKDATSSERFNMLSQYIRTAIASGLMDSKSASAFAKTISSALEDAVLGSAIVSEIRKGISEGSSGMLQLARERQSKILQDQGIRNVQDQGEVSYEDSSKAIGASFQAIQDFSNAAALAREEYLDGTISYDQYISVLNEATDAQSRYSGILSDAIDKTSDIGATAQALDKQLQLLVSPEDFERITSAADIGTSFEQNAWGLSKELFDFMPYQKAIMEFTEELPWNKGKFGLTHEDRQRIEQETKTAMGEAIVSGMNAATVAAVQQYMKENPESKAAAAFSQYEGKGGATQYRAAALAANVETLGLPGELESILTEDQYIDIAIRFMEKGGTVEDFESFMYSIPEERVVEITTAFTGMNPEDQIQMISNWQNLNTMIGQDLAEKVDLALRNRAAATATGVAGVPGQAQGSTLGNQQAQVEGELQRAQSELAVTQLSFGVSTNTEDVERAQAEVNRLQTKLNDIETQIYEVKLELDEAAQKQIEKALDSGVWSKEDTLKVIKMVLNEDPDNLTERLPELTDYARDLQDGIPNEVLKRFNIDLTSTKDLDEFAPFAEELRVLSTMLESFPDEVDKEVAVSLMMNKNGKPVTPKQYAQDVNKLIEIQRDFASKDSVVQKKAIVEFLELYRGPDGAQLTEEEALNAFNSLVERFGEQQILSLPWDILRQTLAVETDVAGIDKAIAALEAAQKLAPEGWIAQRLDALRQLKAAAQNMQVGLVTGGSVGGSSGTGSGSSGGGGGGGGEEDPLKAMMKDLQIQNKLIGDYNKKEGEVSRGFATALRRAGTPEYLIAEIISKGKDGIEIAKKLLKDKQKKLKELMDLSLQVTRMTMIEQNRAAVNNFRTQSNAQNALFGAGIDPSTAIDIASDPQQAAAVADAYNDIEKAQNKLKNAKGKKEREEARKELKNAQKEWDTLTNSIKNATRAQIQFNINQGVKGQAKVERKALGIQGGALTRLMTQGFSFEQARGFADDEMIAGAIVAAGRAADTAAARADTAAKKVENLEKRKKKLREENKRGTKAWKEVNEKLKEARKASEQAADQADKTSKKYKALVADLQALTKAQKANLVTNTIAEYKGLTSELGMQQNILQKLIDSGMSYAQAIEIASDPQKALAFAAALEQGEGVLAQMVAEARALEAATAKFSLAMKMAEFADAKKKNQFLGPVMALTAGNPLGGMVTDYLMNLNTSELQEFFNQTPEWRQEFIDAFLESIPLAEKIKYLFDQISAQQKYQSTLNKDKTNLAKGDIENLEDQLKVQKKLLKAEQDKLKAVQKTIDVIQEENDDLNRGLDLLSRQEEKINESFDKRIDALDKIEQANSRIAQQQQNQITLSQALSEGDIYAAAQAAQQIKQDNAAFAIEETRQALEEAREEQLKNLAVDVNGQLLTREQIENKIESNNDKIYQIQEDQVEVIEAAIDAIQSQIEKVEDLKEAWQDYFEWLEENSKITIEVGTKEIDFTYKELQDFGERFQQIMAMGGKTAEEAFNQVIADLAKAGKTLSADEITALRTYFGVVAPTPPPANAEVEGEAGTEDGTPGAEEEEDGGDTTKDINAARDAAILALPEVQKVFDAAKGVWQAINKWDNNLLNFAKKIVENVNPSISSMRNIFGKIGQHLSETIDPNLTTVRNKLEKSKDFSTTILNKFEKLISILPDLGKTFETSLITSLQNVIDKVNSAIAAVRSLIASIGAVPKKVRVDINVHTTYTSSGSPGGSGVKESLGSSGASPSPTPPPPSSSTLKPTPKPTPKPKPKKFAGGLIRMAAGGTIPGLIPRDSVPLLASPGEFVVRNAMVEKYGLPMLNDINQGSYQPSFQTPASNIAYTNVNSKPAQGGSSRTMYNNNYSINVVANTNANADEIASATVMKIRQMNSMQIRGARG